MECQAKSLVSVALVLDAPNFAERAGTNRSEPERAGTSRKRTLAFIAFMG